MQSIILIGNVADININKIECINHNNCLYQYKESENRYVVVYKDDRLYYEIDSDMINGYEREELNLIPFSNLIFVSLAYTSIDIIKSLFTQKNYLSNIYIDTDFGEIIPIEQFINKIKENLSYDWRKSKY